MANEEQLAILKQGVEVWNEWREKNQVVRINLQDADLRDANLISANLRDADLSGAILFDADLSGAMLVNADLNDADLSGANLFSANLIDSRLCKANLRGAGLSNADFRDSNLINADLRDADLRYANLQDANLINADLEGANLSSTIFRSAHLSGTNLSCTNLQDANLEGANMSAASLLSADLSRANLKGALIVGTIIQDTILKDCRIYGISVWDIVGTPSLESGGLIITPSDQPEVTVDDFKVAQFVYLLLNNEEIRNVLDTIGKKGVLILGRFSPERKEVLDALRDKLRTMNYVPMMFDFEGATTKDFTETIKVLAGMCRFIIADITSPRAITTELEATVPDYKVPFVPIIQEGEEPFAMFANLQSYPWMFDVLEYRDSDQLIAHIDKAIIQPALIKADELNVQKAEEVRKRHISDYQ